MSSINSKISHGITLATTGLYASPLTITTGGYVDNTGTGDAVYGPNSRAWTVVNYGRVTSTATYSSGVDLRDGGLVINSGTMTGGTGGGAYHNGAVYITGAAGTVSNSNTLIGNPAAVVLYSGGLVSNASAGYVSGAISVYNAVGTVINDGRVVASSLPGIVLDAGGTVVNSGTVVPGSAFYGVYLNAGGVLVNNASGYVAGGVYATVLAGTIVNDGRIADAGFPGIVLVAGGTVIDAGTIAGSSAITFYGNSANLLVLENGYKLVGGVHGSGSVGATNTLELAGSLGGAVIVNYNTLGLSGFQDVQFGSGGDATLRIGNIAGTLPVVISGLTLPSDVIDLTQIGTDGSITSQSATAVTVAGSLGSVTLKLDPSDSTHLTTVGDGDTGTELVACFGRGTMIGTETGEVAVEALAIGDRVMTVSGAARPIRWIGRRAYDGRFIAGNRDILPVRIAAGALAAGVPARELRVSPGHSLYLDGQLVPAFCLVNGRTIVQADSVECVEYFHLELDTHDVIFADGAATETYVDCDNRLIFANAADYARLYPEDDRPRWQFCRPPLEWGAPELIEIRRTLLRRARRADYALALDPDLHLVVDGRQVRPEIVGDGTHRFVIPAGSGAVSLASRHTVPAEIDAASGDRRRLGVPVETMALFDGEMSLEVEHGHPALCEGFHADERTHRWTDGFASLPAAWLRLFPAEVTLDVRLIASELGYVMHRPSCRAAVGREAEESIASLPYPDRPHASPGAEQSPGDGEAGRTEAI